MTTPAAGDAMMWSQAQEYDAHDDRLVIAALAGRSRGLVRAPSFTAATGMTLTLGPWHAIVDAGDGTAAVLGSRVPQLWTVAAGTSAQRVDHLFAEMTSADAGGWVPHIGNAASLTGKLGVLLGRVTVPANANSLGASGVVLRPAAIRLGVGAQPAQFPNSVYTTTSFNSMAFNVIPADDAEAGTVYEVDCWGDGSQGNPNQQALSFQVALAPHPTGGDVGIGDTGIGAYSLGGAGNWFRWRAVFRVACISPGPNAAWSSSVQAWTGDYAANAAFGQQNFCSNFWSTGTAAGVNRDSTQDLWLHARVRWQGSAGSPSLTCRVALPRKLGPI